MDTERKLVTIRKIDAIDPIAGADAIEVATIEGWKVVTKKYEFKPGSYCLYFEVDSFLPESDERFGFLMKSGLRQFNGVKGHRLKTIRLRGQLSQGLALPLDKFTEIYEYGNVENRPYPVWQIKIPEDQISKTDPNPVISLYFEEENYDDIRMLDFASVLGIQKYEAPLPGQLSGQVKRYFPPFIRKTDQERCQNLKRDIFEKNLDARYEITIKLDGSSCTFYHNAGEVGVCSRNLELKINEENKDNSFIKIFNDSGVEAALRQLGNIAIQGELMGPGIQGNREGLKAHKLFIFDAQHIDTGEYFTWEERAELMKKFTDLGVNTDLIDHAPILTSGVTLAEMNVSNIEELLALADGASLYHPMREGLVFKRADGKFSFKAISNKFLLQEKD